MIMNRLRMSIVKHFQMTEFFLESRQRTIEPSNSALPSKSSCYGGVCT